MLDVSSIENRAAEWFAPVPGYLNTASVGLPPRATMTELHRRLAEWEAGGTDPPTFDADVARARAAYARIVGVNPAAVAIIGPASTGVGMVAASLPDGAVVLCAEEDFTSVLFPFLADPRLKVRSVPLADLLGSIDDDVDIVAVSAAQSADGRVFDLDGLAEIAARTGFRTLVDSTQAAGWLPIAAGRFDVTVCHSYKWLCSPRGAGFLTVNESALDWLRPVNAGWYAGEDRWSSIYGPPLRLATDARRFDTSPDWFSIAGAVPALELLADLGPEALGGHGVGLANEFRRLVGLAPSNSAIVSVATTAGPDLAAAGIVTAVRAGLVRLSFHLYNTRADVERSAEIVAAGR
jgi:selenocysteine lyase/cysteine desulfurase